ncbi:hypothetical protein BDV06DRAFT_1070 [Aspergillus oleicola]
MFTRRGGNDPNLLLRLTTISQANVLFYGLLDPCLIWGVFKTFKTLPANFFLVSSRRVVLSSILTDYQMAYSRELRTSASVRCVVLSLVVLLVYLVVLYGIALVFDPREIGTLYLELARSWSSRANALDEAFCFCQVDRREEATLKNSKPMPLEN